jgi:gliding motility-associated-like protein
MYGTSTGWDWMVIYEGTGTGGAVLFDNRSSGPDNPRGTDCDFINNNDVLNLISAQDQCLTFRFYATGVVNREGWDALVTSSPVPGSGAVNVDVTNPSCTADGSAQILNYDNTATYTFTPAGPTLGSNGEIIGAVFGQNYSVEVGSSGCPTSFQIEEQVLAPAVPTFNITAPTCVADGSAEITNYLSGATYTFNPAGPSVGGTGAITGASFGQNYTVEVENGGCTETATFQIEEQLATPAIPNFAITAPTCAADGSAELTNYDNGVTYTFTPLGPSIGGSGEITNAILGQSYTVEVDDGNCTETATFQIEEQLETPDEPSFNLLDPTCMDDGSAEISNYEATATYTFTPAGPSIGSSGEITGAIFGQNYNVEIDNGDCTANSSFQVEAQLDTPQPDFFADTLTGCNPHSVTFTDTSGLLNTTCSWDFGDGNTSTSCGTVTHTYTQSGTYDITLTMEFANGCVGDTTITSYIEVADSPIADFTANPITTDFNNTEVDFSNESINATNYIWDFGDLSPQSNDVNPLHAFPNGIANEYPVTLYAIGDFGCIDSTSLTIIINNPDIEISIPNVFTPNGDNENDFFQLITVENILELEVVILNRWGNLVFESSDLNFKWNGSIQNNGQECSDGTYFYKIMAKDMNGEEVLKHGFVHLSRGE